jgi:hypothetical protein
MAKFKDHEGDKITILCPLCREPLDLELTVIEDAAANVYSDLVSIRILLTLFGVDKMFLEAENNIQTQYKKLLDNRVISSKNAQISKDVISEVHECLTMIRNGNTMINEATARFHKMTDIRNHIGSTLLQERKDALVEAEKVERDEQLRIEAEQIAREEHANYIRKENERRKADNARIAKKEAEYKRAERAAQADQLRKEAEIKQSMQEQAKRERLQAAERVKNEKQDKAMNDFLQTVHALEEPTRASTMKTRKARGNRK